MLLQSVYSRKQLTLGECVQSVAVNDFNSFKEFTALVGVGEVKTIRICREYEINRNVSENAFKSFNLASTARRVH